MNASMKTVGERVRWARGKRGLTLAELDEVADLAAGHSGSIERGTRETPSAKTVSKLASALKVDAAWIMFGGKAPRIAGAG
jgi:transcriptional regulator with XRE-family HTH domain